MVVEGRIGGIIDSVSGLGVIISKRLVIIILSRVLDHAPEGGDWKGTIPMLLNTSSEYAIAQSRRAVNANVESIQINIQDFAVQSLPFSLVRLLGTTRPGRASFLEDTIVFQANLSLHHPTDFEGFRRGVYDTAHMLKGADPRLMSILECAGVRK